MITAVAFLAFAFLHSLTVSRFFKRWLTGLAGETFMRAYYRLLFTIFSAVITFLTAYIIYIQPDFVYLTFPWYLHWPMRAVQLGGVMLMLLAFRPFDAGYFTGIRQAREYVGLGRTGGDIEGIRDNALITDGVYGLVRHPMYLGGILIFLFEPEITQKTLILRVLATGYFVWGGFIEERRFVQDFGDAYREYKKGVPAFNVLKWVSKRRRPQA